MDKITGLAFGAVYLKQGNLFKMSTAACKKNTSFQEHLPVAASKCNTGNKAFNKVSFMTLLRKIF